MKRVLFLAVCLLMIASLTLPVLATEEYWEAEVDTEETIAEDSEQVYIQWATGEPIQFENGITFFPADGEVEYELVTVDPDSYQAITVMPEQWTIGALDGEQVIAVPGQSLTMGPSRAFSVIPSAVLAVIAILAVILAVALLVIIVVIAIVLIIKSARKKKNTDPEEV